MKKALTDWFVFLFLLATTSFLFVGCGAKKTVSENKEEVSKETSNTFIATNDKTTISQAVQDSISKKIPFIKTGVKDCDSICNEKVDDLLEQLDFYKKSGDNLQQMYYNREKRLLTINTKLQETVSQLKDSVKVEEKNFTKTITKTITITKPKLYIPLIVKILAGLGLFYFIRIGWRIAKIFM